MHIFRQLFLTKNILTERPNRLFQ